MVKKKDMNKEYILALDQGTSSCRAIIFNKKADIVGIEQKEFRQIFPHAGWVEHDPEEIFSVQLEVAEKVLMNNKILPEQINCIGITNQRETCLLWDKNTGKPVYNAIVWQDTRTSDFCENLKKTSWLEYIKKTTGLMIDSYFSASKIKWIFENVSGVRKKAEEGNILFGTIDTWLLWKFSGGKSHFTDVSNASRTMLFDISKLKWDKKLLELFNIPQSILPEVTETSYLFGHTSCSVFLNSEIPITAMVGDQQAALFGQACFDPGMIKNTYGTGCFALMNTGEKIKQSEHGLLTTIAWKLNGKTNYALEGSVFIAGAAIQWLRDGLQMINSATETEALAESSNKDNDLYFVPAFTGLGTPYWDMYARGAIIGITRDIRHKEIVRAALDAIAYQTRDVIDVMISDSGLQMKQINVDGGACANNYLMQFQSDILNVVIARPLITESTALGAAFFAGLHTGFWTINDIKNIKKTDRIFTPTITQQKREQLYSGWKKAVEKVRNK